MDDCLCLRIKVEAPFATAFGIGAGLFVPLMPYALLWTAVRVLRKGK